MDNFETNILRNVSLAPYIQVATALIGKARKIGGNQFRHNWATLGILIDHKIIEPVILKAGVIHDLKEDAFASYFPEQIRLIDSDGRKVVELVEELSIIPGEKKVTYLERLMHTGSREAKVIKLADRISNLIDIQLGTFDIHKVKETLDETNNYILPFAKEINENMYLEMSDLITSRTKYVQRTIELIACRVMDRIKNIVIDIENISEVTTEGISNVDDLRKEFISSFHKLETEISSDLLIHSIYNNVY
jgi:GTP pyrophosphokinase